MRTQFIVLVAILLFMSINSNAQQMPDTTGWSKAAKAAIVTAQINYAGLAGQKAQVDGDLATCKDQKERNDQMIIKKDTIIAGLKRKIRALENGDENSEIMIDTLRKRVVILRKSLKKISKERGDFEEDLMDLEEKCGNIKELEANAARLVTVENEKNELDQKLLDALNTNKQLTAQNESLTGQLATANQKARTLQTQLNTLQTNYDKLLRESKAYAEAIRKQFKALQERAGQVMQAKAWTIDPASRKAMVAEVESLRNQVAEGDKAALATVSGQVYKIEAFGEVLDKAKQTLAENYNKNAVATATANLQRADIKGFSSEVGQEKQRVLALLTNYCEEYARVQDVFRQFNSLNKPQTTLRLLPKLMSEPGSIDPGHTFIRKQLDYRKANPAATDQPFTTSADCK